LFLFYNSVAKLYFNGIINLKLGVLKKGCDKVKTTSDWQCPYCKAQINPGDQICIHCGEKIYDTNVTIADLHHHEEEKKINKKKYWGLLLILGGLLFIILIFVLVL
jgi:hypothetical protein